jgi:hypothetical protein
VVGEALICLGFSAVTKNRCADNFLKRRRKLSEFEPSLRQKPEFRPQPEGCTEGVESRMTPGIPLRAALYLRPKGFSRDPQIRVNGLGRRI